MKALTTLIIGGMLALASCSKAITNGPGILGKWVVTESYADPGDGSGTWKKTGTPKPYYLFRADSTVEIGKVGNAAPEQTVRFSVLDSSKVRFDFTQGAMVYRYNLVENRLTLSPPCIEGCGMRLERPE